MFGRRILGGHPDGFRMSMGFEVARPNEQPLSPQSPKSLTVTPTQKSKSLGLDSLDFWEQSAEGTCIETLDVEWTSDDPDPVAISRLKKAGNVSGILEERVRVNILPVPQGGITNAATFQKEVQVGLQVVQIPAQLRRLEFARITPSGNPHLTLLTTLMRECYLEGVTGLQCAENLVPLWEDSLITRLSDLKALLLDSCVLTTLSPVVGSLTNLRELRVASNRLTALPREIGSLVMLQRLVADNNLISSIPVELRHCSRLQEISLENNRLAAPVLDLRALSNLRSLQLFGNPLEFLPELSPCTLLRQLSLVNVRLQSDEGWSNWEVDVAPASQSYMSRGTHKLAPLFGLIFRRSSCQHPLLAGTLGKISEDPANCSMVFREVGAIQQLILMALSDNEIVVEQACKTIGLVSSFKFTGSRAGQLGRSNSITTNEIIDSSVLSAMISLIGSVKHKNQLAGLAVISGLALSSETAARKLLTPDLLKALKELVRSGADDVKTATLETIGNLAFAHANKVSFLHTAGLLGWLARLAKGQVGGVSQKGVQIAAIRALAILGENEGVRQAVGRPPILNRGIRILSMDGGGMKGIAIIRQLRQLEERTGRRIHELFDLICGTSTGGILAVALALKHFTLDECEQVYRSLGQRVFMRPSAKDDDGWRESLYRVYKSGQQSMRVAVYGCKHDAAMFELLLKEYCIFDTPGLAGNAMIDTACLAVPKCFVVSTLASMTPAEPFLFRNYEYPLSSTPLAKKLMGLPGSSSHQVWEAVRASSAAPYYLDDFKCGNNRFQDGAATANNPAAIAVQEARILWPDIHVEALVSMGTGTVPVHKREKSMSAYVDTGNVLIESACSVDRVAAALATFAPMVPGLSYFRFCPSDLRCGIELDEIDPAKWALLEAATDEYIVREDARFDACAQLLIHHMVDAQPAPKDISTISLGWRRKVLVIEAPRSDAAASRQGGSCLEAATEAVASLPQCHQRVQLSTDGSETPDIGAFNISQEIASHLEQCREKVGVVHLGMYGDESGLVIQWTRKLEAVAEPSAAAEALLREIGETSTGLLSELAGNRQGYEGEGESWIQLLSQHTDLSHQPPVAAVLYQRTRPSAHLTAAEVAKMLSSWESLIVVTASVVPKTLAKALLEAGAKAVVCREAGSSLDDSSLSGIPDYFAAFYSLLLSGRPIMKSLAHAGAVVPSLAGVFVCCYLNDEVLTAAESEPRQKLPDLQHLLSPLEPLDDNKEIGALPESTEAAVKSRYRSRSG